MRLPAFRQAAAIAVDRASPPREVLARLIGSCFLISTFALAGYALNLALSGQGFEAIALGLLVLGLGRLGLWLAPTSWPPPPRWKPPPDGA